MGRLPIALARRDDFMTGGDDRLPTAFDVHCRGWGVGKF